jgi:hypothetical protein
MKSLLKKTLLLIIAAVTITSANCQTVSSILSNLGNSSKKNSGVVSSIVDNLVGTKSVSLNSLVGTWTYSKPAVAFESQNALSKIGGSVVSNKIETKLSSIFTKAGISKGKFSITFASDGTFTTTMNNRKISGVYTLSGSTITFSKTKDAKLKVNANVKLGTTLQITFKANKLLQFAKQFGSLAGSASTTLSTVSSLMSNYSGVQIGMHFTKK